jgi:hypothetical protein
MIVRINGRHGLKKTEDEQSSTCERLEEEELDHDRRGVLSLSLFLSHSG